MVQFLFKNFHEQPVLPSKEPGVEAIKRKLGKYAAQRDPHLEVIDSIVPYHGFDKGHLFYFLVIVCPHIASNTAENLKL